jgi:putative colanic acid biosynthesis UDP-glucose lipid carrier transferase
MSPPPTNSAALHRVIADGAINAPSRPASLRNISLRNATSLASCIGTSESPSSALVRHLLFPVSAVLSLLISAGLFSQPITRPYAILSVLTFALTWKLLGSADFHELRPLAQMELFIPRVLLGWAKVLGVLFFLGFVAKISAQYSRAVIITWAISTPFLYAVTHILAYRFVCQWNRRGRIARTHVIVGTNANAREMAERLEGDASLGTFIGYFSTNADASRSIQRNVIGTAPGNLLGRLDELAEYVRRNAIDVIHIAWPMDEQVESAPRLKQLLEDLRDTTASIYFLLDVPRQDKHSPARIVEIAGMPLLAYVETPHCGLNGVTKRCVDLAIAVAMVIFLFPVFLLIALLIRLDSRGPAVFRQRRYGLNGEEFPVYKFRSMTVCEDGKEIAQAKRNDPRITRVGRFLRRTSLDELPQLFCVLTGSMSLVGPRPHAVAHNEQYRHLIDGYMLRHKIRPGITGWAQVNGLRGETRTVEQMRARVLFDLEYLRHWSPWVDIKILLRTALLVVRDRNAY